MAKTPVTVNGARPCDRATDGVEGVEIAREPSDQGWGILSAIRMPDGGELPIYEPRPPSPHPA